MKQIHHLLLRSSSLSTCLPGVLPNYNANIINSQRTTSTGTCTHLILSLGGRHGYGLRTVRQFSKTSSSAGHENPLGLPRSNSPPQLPRMQRGLPTKRRIPNVAKTLLISSAKGGVGKSTVAANIAVAAALGLHVPSIQGSSDTMDTTEKIDTNHPLNRPLKVGLLDLDLFGPSIPKLLKLEGHQPRVDSRDRLLPLVNYGVKSMSMGYLIGGGSGGGEGAPVAWRGLMVMKAVQQLLWEVEWGGIQGEGVDLLVVDMPPGTGDVQLTVGQQVVVDGAVIVTTPQDIALIDAIKGVNMFRKMDIPILGLTLNMSHYTCPTCTTPHYIFGRGPTSVNNACKDLGIDVLGNIPLEPRVCGDADDGRPTVVSSSDEEAGGSGSEVKKVFGEVVREVVERLWRE